MPALEMLQYPDPVLKEASLEVNKIDASIMGFIDDLVLTMKASPGVGLAAPQVGRLVRIITVDVTPKHPGHGLVILINPQIISSKGGKIGREGCLSVPEYTANIMRAEEVTIRGLSVDGSEARMTSTGFEAVALQHEIDHLNGILFIDRITNMKRDLFKRNIKRL
jgi:peptide deformylase